MKRAVDIPVTVKCRIGIDDQDPETALDALAGGVVAAGADAVISMPARPGSMDFRRSKIATFRRSTTTGSIG